MQDFVQKLIENKELIYSATPLVFFVVDYFAGKIPDRFFPYIGLTRRLVDYIISKRNGRI